MTAHSRRINENGLVDIERLRRKYEALKEQNDHLQELLSERQNYIQNDVERKLCATAEENAHLKEVIARFHRQCKLKFADICAVLTIKSSPCAEDCSRDSTANSDVDTEEDDSAAAAAVSLLNDLYESLCSVLQRGRLFVSQQNRLRNEMQRITA